MIGREDEGLDLPYSQACENNQHAILAGIRPQLESLQSVLEIGSGTGQHAVHFAANLPHLKWHTSDLLANHAGIQAWINDSGLDNIAPPIELDVRTYNWPEGTLQAIFTANALHIMSWESAKILITNAASALAAQGLLIVYGPFNYGGQYTSSSNQRFDQWLLSQHPQSAIRDFEKVDSLAQRAMLTLIEDRTMPANNRLLIWRKNAPTEDDHSPV